MLPWASRVCSWRLRVLVGWLSNGCDSLHSPDPIADPSSTTIACSARIPGPTMDRSFAPSGGALLNSCVPMRCDCDPLAAPPAGTYGVPRSSVISQ